MKTLRNPLRKTAEITDSLGADNSFVMDADVAFEGRHPTQLELSTQDEVHEITVKSSSKSCDFDLLPTYLLMQVLEQIIPLITAVI